MTRILLLGANGQVGRAIGGQLAQHPLGELVAATRTGTLVDGTHCEVADLGQPEALNALLEAVQPTIIINAAAYTAVDRAEDEESLAHVINADAVGVIGAWAALSGALVVHFSTDYVFDGQSQRPYGEDDATAPLGAYGRSKLAGEERLQHSGASHFIFRTAWVYDANGQNFLRTMLRLASERDELRVVGDQTGAPTSAGLIAEGSLAAMTRWIDAPPDQRKYLSGTYHLVATGQTTWHGFASRIVESARQYGILTQSPSVIAITTAEFPTRARRPVYSVLDTTHFQKTFGVTLPSWQSGLEEVLKKVGNRS